MRACRALLLLPLLGGFAPAQDWPMFRGTPDHLGPALASRLPQKAAWRFRTRGKVRGTPAVCGDTVYVGSEDGHLYALALADGRERWRFRTGDEVPSSPAVAGGLVLFQGRDNVLRALDARDGRERWSYACGPELPPRPGDYLGWDYWVSSPTVDGDTVYVGGGDGRLHALELLSGKPRWSFATRQRIRSTPAVKDGLVYAGSFDGCVYAVDARTGAECWRFETGGGIQSSPVLWKDTLFIGSRAAAVFALDARSGALRWRTPHPNGSWVLATPAVAEGKVLVGSSDEQFLQALDAATGRECWRLETRSRVLGAVTVAGSVVLAGTESAYLYAVDLDSGLALAASGCEGAIHGSPVLTGERLLVGSDDSHLRAFATVPAPSLPPPAPEARLQACSGLFEAPEAGLRLRLTPQHGRLRVDMGSFAPALGVLEEDGRFRIPAYHLEGQATFPAGGGPARLTLRLGKQDVPLRPVSPAR